MPNKNTTLFISDLHLDAADPKTTETFFYFLEHIAPDADALYILGDFFEAYIGDDDHNPFLKAVKNALSKAAEKGLSIFLMHGNRDFLIGEKFALESGLTLLPDPHLIDLYGQKILLMHGDSLCTEDKSYLRFRKIARNKCVQKLFLLLPLSFRQKFTGRLRKESATYIQEKSTEIMDVSDNAVHQALEHTQAAILIHGHTHKPAIHLLADHKKRVVLSAWHDGGHYVRINTAGDIESLNI